MAFAITLMIIGMVVSCTNNILASAWDKPAQVIHVGGKVVCQDCSKGWKEWVNGDKAIKGIQFVTEIFEKKIKFLLYENKNKNHF
jgi:hypothetical protein